MRRPIRTRRLSIAAVLSLLAFGVVASAGIRSFWDETDLPIKGWGSLGLSHGTLMCQHVWDQEPSWNKLGSLSYSDHRLMGFAMTKSVAGFGAADRWVEVPLWFPLLLLLIAPVRWLIGHPANAPAFPVITDTKQEHS